MTIRRTQRIQAPPNTAAIYARYSSTNQREESIDAQIRACTSFAQAEGLIVVQIYTDSAKTGTNDNRPEFQRLLSDSGKGLFDTVIVHKLDRFARDRYDSVIHRQKLKSNRCKLISVTERLDDSPESIMLTSVIEGMNEYYSKNLAREVMKGQKETALQCKHVGGMPPLGYDVDQPTKKYIINEKEAEIVRLIFQMYAEGKSYSSILRHLNAMGYRTKANHQFAKGSLNNLLKNEKYKGIFLFNQKKEKDYDGVRRPHAKPPEEVIRIENGMPRIIDDITFAKVQNLLQRNLKRGGSFRSKELYLLSGLVFCGNCGKAMSGNSRYCGRNKLKYVTYRCHSRAQQRECKAKEINKTYLENFVLDALYQHLFNEHTIQKLTELLNQYRSDLQRKNETDLEQASKRLKTVTQEIASALEVVCHAGISIDTIRERLQELEAQKDYLEEHIQTLSIHTSLQASESMVSDLVQKSKVFVKTKSLPECKTFLNSYIEKVMVYADHVQVYFQIYIPSENQTELQQLIVKESLKNIYANYKDAV